MDGIQDSSPDSAGSLQIGTPLFEGGIFSCDMIFTTHNGVPISNSHMRSAAISAAIEFKRLLQMNGFFKHGEPRSDVRPVVGRPDLMAMMISVTAERGFGKPEIINTGQAQLRKTNRAERRAVKKLH